MKIIISCALLVGLMMIGTSSGQIADFNDRVLESDDITSVSDLVSSPFNESQGLLPSIEPVDSQMQFEMEWSNWIDLEGIRVTTPPAIVLSGPNIINVFVGGGENELWNICYQDVWSEWKKIFGPPPYNKDSQGVSFRKYDLAVVYIDPGTYYLFTWGPRNHCLYKRCWSEETCVTCNQTEDWISIEGKIGSRPAAVVCSDKIYLFALNESGWLIWNRADLESTDEENIVWNGWSALRGPFKSAPSVTSVGNDIHIFVLNEDIDIAHITWSTETGKTSTDTIKYKMKSDPATTSCGTRIDVFGIEDDDLMHTRYNGTTWQSWENLGGGDVTGQPAAVSDRSGQIWVFAQGAGENLWCIKYGPPD
ncbi:MAG: PLL family lectin [Methanotrichaceae archaeon]